MDIDCFKNPPKEFRPIPFWSWNDDLNDAELSKQIGEMDNNGWGGFFMHSRVGLVTPYLSDEWFDRVGTCIHEAQRRGMGAWLYDEDKWPSGAAAGCIAKKGPEYRSKALFLAEGTISHPDEDVKILKVYAAIKNEAVDRGRFFPKGSGKPINIVGEISVEQAKSQPEGITILYFYQWTAPLGDDWFGGGSYVDMLNPDVVKEFISSTHEEYAKRFQKYFGNAVPGIFTDEPLCLFQGYRKNILPWTSNLSDIFFKEYGYNLLDYLPQLYFVLDGYEKVRFEYRKLITKLFLESYTKAVHGWCESKELKFTGHFMCEDDLVRNLHWIGSLLPHYKFMHIPGIDHLGRKTNDIITQKQLQSVVNQFKKERALTETYGCSGQNTSFEDYKWICDWQFVNGVNLINLHLSLYSMRGERKRDYPPNIFYQQPWWKYNKVMADYQSRISYVLSEGERVIDILVIHPIESAYIAYTPLNHAEAQGLNSFFEKTLFTLLENHWDFDLGDEELMETDGRVEDDKFILGYTRYKIIILPSLVNLRGNTLKLLKDFTGNGGKVIALGRLPEYINGIYEKERIKTELYKARIGTFYNIDAILKEVLHPQVSIRLTTGKNANKVYYHKRKTNFGFIYFFVNNDRDNSADTVIQIPEPGKVWLLDTFSGEKNEFCTNYIEGYSGIKYNFPPAGSLLLEVDTSEVMANTVPLEYTLVETLPLRGDWRMTLHQKNAVTLDYCSYALGIGKFSKTMHHLQVNDAVKSELDGVTLQYTFNNRGWDGLGGEIVIENAHLMEIKVNGQLVSADPNKYWIDTSFKRIAIDGLVKEGVNIVEVIIPKGVLIEVEAAYIIGDFKVETEDNASFVIVACGEIALKEDLSREGYPFYAGLVDIEGSVLLEEEKGKYVLEIVELNAAIAEVIVNGYSAGYIYCKNYKLDITPFIIKGENNITLRLANTLHNLLGPHHNVEGEVVPVGPGSFRKNAKWVDEYYFTPFGVKGVSLCIYR